MRCLVFLIGGIISFLTLGDMAHATTQSGSSPQLNAGIIVFILAVWGLYRSKKGKIVVFANLTDVLVTLSVPVMVVVVLFGGGIAGFTNSLIFKLMWITGILGGLFVAKATKAYNKSIGAGFFGFLHALITKLAIVGLYVLAMLAIFQYGGAGKRKYEHEATRIRRARRNRALGYGISSLVFAIMTFFGLWNSKFVSLGEYSSGSWGEKEGEDVEEECDEDN